MGKFDSYDLLGLLILYVSKLIIFSTFTKTLKDQTEILKNFTTIHITTVWSQNSPEKLNKKPKMMMMYWWMENES